MTIELSMVVWHLTLIPMCMCRNTYNRDGKCAAKMMRFFQISLSLYFFTSTVELLVLDNLPVNPLAGLQPNKNDNKIFIRLQKLNF